MRTRDDVRVELLAGSAAQDIVISSFARNRLHCLRKTSPTFNGLTYTLCYMTDEEILTLDRHISQQKVNRETSDRGCR